MEQIKWSYFQYRRSHDYPVYIRLKHQELNPRFNHLLNELGFNELSETESKKISLHKPHTRILTIQEASSRLQLQINGSNLLDQYGVESLSFQAGMPIYTYRKMGIMAYPLNKTLWDLAIHPDISQNEQMVGMRIILVRFLSQALSELGVLSYWGTIKEDTVLVMKQLNSFGEAVFIDLNKNMIFSNGGELKLMSQLKIIRKDKEIQVASTMKREELISFLSVSTCLLSFNGISTAMKKAAYELSARSTASYAITEATINL